ncbi:MAG: L-rhamnose isomerase [Eubacteriales bacterium]|nr:L-rhamnose isomerase [Eubacteriales bacterium]
MSTYNRYNTAKEIYASIGVDTDLAIQKLKDIKISMQCWQGDDVRGFLTDQPISGGISVTGNHPGAAKNAAELRADMEKAFSLIPGRHKVNLHSIYVDSEKKPQLDNIAPEHYMPWVEWASEKSLGLDFNPTCFSHPLSSSGFTISSADKNIREFWIEHCKRCREIGKHFGEKLGQTSVVNYWFPDGYKDIPINPEGPRRRMIESLDRIFEEEMDKNLIAESLEGKLFGIGSESYVTGSNDFTAAYAISRKKMVCLDTGHFHPTESIADKIPTMMLFSDKMLLHVSRPVRWDSDHVVTFSDELKAISHTLVRGDYLGRVYFGLDYFDASINRVAAWVIGMRNMQKALLVALLEPTNQLKELETEGDYTARLALCEELKSFPFSDVYDFFCEQNDVPLREKWLNDVKKYEREVQFKRA